MRNRDKEPKTINIAIAIHAFFDKGFVYAFRFMPPSGFLMKREWYMFINGWLKVTTSLRSLVTVKA